MANMLDRRYERLHRRLKMLEAYEKIPRDYALEYKKLEIYIRNNEYVLKKYEDIYQAERKAVKEQVQRIKGKC